MSLIPCGRYRYQGRAGWYNYGYMYPHFLKRYFIFLSVFFSIFFQLSSSPEKKLPHTIIDYYIRPILYRTKHSIAICSPFSTILSCSRMLSTSPQTTCDATHLDHRPVNSHVQYRKTLTIKKLALNHLEVLIFLFKTTAAAI